MYIFLFRLICIFFEILFWGGVWTFDVVGGGAYHGRARYTCFFLLSLLIGFLAPFSAFFFSGAMNWRFGLVLCKSYLSIFFYFFGVLFFHQDVLSRRMELVVSDLSPDYSKANRTIYLITVFFFFPPSSPLIPQFIQLYKTALTS